VTCIDLPAARVGASHAARIEGVVRIGLVPASIAPGASAAAAPPATTPTSPFPASIDANSGIGPEPSIPAKPSIDPTAPTTTVPSVGVSPAVDIRRVTARQRAEGAGWDDKQQREHETAHEDLHVLGRASRTEKIFSFRGPHRRLTGVALALAIAALVCAESLALAERRIMVDAPDAPFAAGELADAIRVRIGDAGAPVHVRVTPIVGGVRVEIAGGARDVELRGLSGVPAARLVALSADDLLLDDLSASTSPAKRAPRFAVEIAAGAAAWSNPVVDGEIGLVLPRGPWRLAIEAGAGALVGGDVQLALGIVRLGVGRLIGSFELRAGATAEPLFVSTGVGDTTVLAGGGASVRVHLALTDALAAVVALGLDVFADRTHYELGTTTAFVTPTWSPWLTVGLEVTR
jgi:hypothetical protein